MNSEILTQAFTATSGVFTPDMAAGLGISNRQIARWRADGALVRVAGLAVAPASIALTPRHRGIAAVLTWPDAVVCFRTAGILHGFDVDDGGATDVLVPNGRRPSKGIAPHFWSVRPTEVDIQGALRLTDRRTTLADLLSKLPDREAWALLAWLWTRDQITVEDLRHQIHDRRRLYGIVRLRAMVAAVLDGAVSVGEVRFHDFLRSHGFVGWKGDRKIRHRGRIVARADVLFEEVGVIVEFDGAIAHDEDTADSDTARDELLRSLGYVVEHVTWWQMYERPRELVARLRAALAEGAARRALASETAVTSPTVRNSGDFTNRPKQR